MKRILFLMMFFGLSHFAIAGEECSNESGGICSEDFSESNLDLDDNSETFEEGDSAEKANFYRCVSVNRRTGRWGVGFNQNYWKSALQAYNNCKANSWRFARFCQRPTCNRVHLPGPGPFPFPFPFPGGGGPGGPGGGGPGGGGPGGGGPGGGGPGGGGPGGGGPGGGGPGGGGPGGGGPGGGGPGLY